MFYVESNNEATTVMAKGCSVLHTNTDRVTNSAGFVHYSYQTDIGLGCIRLFEIYGNTMLSMSDVLITPGYDGCPLPWHGTSFWRSIRDTEVIRYVRSRRCMDPYRGFEKCGARDKSDFYRRQQNERCYLHLLVAIAIQTRVYAAGICER